MTRDDEENLIWYRIGGPGRGKSLEAFNARRIIAGRQGIGKTAQPHRYRDPYKYLRSMGRTLRPGPRRFDNKVALDRYIHMLRCNRYIFEDWLGRPGQDI